MAFLSLSSGGYLPLVMPVCHFDPCHIAAVADVDVSELQTLSSSPSLTCNKSSVLHLNSRCVFSLVQVTLTAALTSHSPAHL